MKDEIKEILEFKENADYKRLSCDEMAILKDYITNLEQRINKALHLITHSDITDYRVFDEELLSILSGEDNET